MFKKPKTCSTDIGLHTNIYFTNETIDVFNGKVIDLKVVDDITVQIIYEFCGSQDDWYLELSEVDNLDKMDKDELAELLLENYSDMFSA